MDDRLIITLIITVAVVWTTVEGRNKIQMGTPGDIKTFPFVGSFQIPQFSEGRRHVCTTVLVNKMIAVTAGHCLVLGKHDPPVPIPLDQFKGFVIMGVTDYTDETNPEFQKSQVSRIHLHDRMKLGSDSFVRDYYDIGALLLGTEMKMSPTVAIIPLIPKELNPSSVESEMTEKKKQCDLVGWGALEVSYREPRALTFPKGLQVAKFTLLPLESCCELIYPSDMQSDCFNTLGVKSGVSCHVKYVLNSSASTGDSGAPIVCFWPKTGERYVVGIHVGGRKSRGPYLQGPVEVFNPSFRIIESVLAEYIRMLETLFSIAMSEGDTCKLSNSLIALTISAMLFAE